VFVVSTRVVIICRPAGSGVLTVCPLVACAGITNGIYADYFTTAVRTGGEGQGGISLLLIERSEGVTTKQMQCQGMWASGTTYVTFENVKGQ
jgi:hypothetical protein